MKANQNFLLFSTTTRITGGPVLSASAPSQSPGAYLLRTRPAAAAAADAPSPPHPSAPQQAPPIAGKGVAAGGSGKQA